MASHTLKLTTIPLFSVISLLIISCSTPGSGIISQFNKKIGSEAITKEFRKGDTSYTWNNVSSQKDAELKAIVDECMKIHPSDSLALSPYYDVHGKVVPGKFMKYWVYEESKYGVEVNYIITGKTMTVMVRITEKIGAQ